MLSCRSFFWRWRVLTLELSYENDASLVTSARGREHVAHGSFMAEVNAEFGANLCSFADFHGFRFAKQKRSGPRPGTFWA